MEVTSEVIEQTLINNPDTPIMEIARMLGIKHHKVYKVRYELLRKEKTKRYSMPVDNSPKAVPVVLRVHSKYGYETFRGYDVSSFWGL